MKSANELAVGDRAASLESSLAVANEAMVVDRIEGLIAEAAELRSLR